MIKTLQRLGNSDALIISKDMKAHLGLTDNRIEIEYLDGRIVLTHAPPTPEENHEISFQDTMRHIWDTPEEDAAWRDL